MKAAVIGSREFDDYEKLKEILSFFPITKIISGGARGADSLSERYAKENGIPTEIYLAQWDLFVDILPRLKCVGFLVPFQS